MNYIQIYEIHSMTGQTQINITVTIEPDISISRYIVTDKTIIDKLYSYNGSTIDKLDIYIHNVVIPACEDNDIDTLANYLFTQPIGRTVDITMTKAYDDSCFTYRLITYTYYYDTGYDVSQDYIMNDSIERNTNTKIYYGKI